MYLFTKRLLDIFVSGLVLILLMPLFIPVIVGLSLTGEREVFYFQRRIGYKRKYFDIWKFATMLKNSPNIGTGSITLRNDPRLLPMGKFLRATKINELPQIINVLKGDMSLVGPRPLVDKTFNAYSEEVRARIYDARPGITGIGSIVFRDEEKLISNATIPPHEYYQQVIAPYKGALEMWYIDNKSMKTDLIIIFLTAWVILKPESELMYKILKGLPERSF